MSFLLSTTGKGGTRNWTGDLLICSQMLYHWAIPPWNRDHNIKWNKLYFILTTINQLLHFEARTLIIPEFHQILRRHPDLNQGPLHLQSNALILSHTPCSQKLRTKARKLHTWFWQHQTKTEVRNVSFLLSTTGKGGTRNWTGDRLICSQMLYHWAIPPWNRDHNIKLNKLYFILTTINQLLHFEARTLIIPEFHQILRRHPDLNQGPLHL